MLSAIWFVCREVDEKFVGVYIIANSATEAIAVACRLFGWPSNTTGVFADGCP